MLETIREFALEQLAPNDAEDLGRRHATYFAALAETAASELGGFGQMPPPVRVSDEGSDEADWLDRVWSDVDNFRSAFEWARGRAEATLLARLAVALAMFFQDFADHREAGSWLHIAEEHAARSNRHGEPISSSSWPTTTSGTVATGPSSVDAMPNALRSGSRSGMTSEQRSR